LISNAIRNWPIALERIEIVCDLCRELFCAVARMPRGHQSGSEPPHPLLIGFSFGQSHSSLAGVPLAQGGIDDVPLVVVLDP
jgi:hypothetical protein